jgi:Ni2+-binding GTPase involved in maturation of urease and hydrogenase
LRKNIADYIIYVIDVAGGDKVPRKGGTENENSPKKKQKKKTILTRSHFI